jgi:hypothetical protein
MGPSWFLELNDSGALWKARKYGTQVLINLAFFDQLSSGSLVSEKVLGAHYQARYLRFSSSKPIGDPCSLHTRTTASHSFLMVIST